MGRKVFYEECHRTENAPICPKCFSKILNWWASFMADMEED